MLVRHFEKNIRYHFQMHLLNIHRVLVSFVKFDTTRKSVVASKLLRWFWAHVIYILVQIRKFRIKQPQQILINLCLALLGLYVVFIVGIDRRHPTTLCIVFGFLIHYFLLASMAWMLVEAVNMYLMFIKVLNVSISRFMFKAGLCAWGEYGIESKLIPQKVKINFNVWLWSYFEHYFSHDGALTRSSLIYLALF